MFKGKKAKFSSGWERNPGIGGHFYLRLAGQSEDMSVRPFVRSFVRPFGTVSKKGECQIEGFPELLQMIKRNANLRDFPELLQFLYASTSS